MDDELVERVARAMAKAITSQVRSGATFDETPTMMIADEDSNSFWEILPVARAAIDEIVKGAQSCGVCGCAVYKGLPTKTSPHS
jgi:hypothetical protein